MSIKNLKNKSGREFFASIIGKSTIDKDGEEHKMIQDVTKYLLEEKRFGVIHGGYEGGTMSAVSDAANEVISLKGFPEEANIGVPQMQHDNLWPRVSKASFTEVAKDIQDRLRMVLAGDVIVVAPFGGDGTHLEFTLAFHENVIKDTQNQEAVVEKVKPIIFLCTKKGTNWKDLIDITINLLDNGKSSVKEYSWIHFVYSIKEFKELINKNFINSLLNKK